MLSAEEQGDKILDSLEKQNAQAAKPDASLHVLLNLAGQVQMGQTIAKLVEGITLTQLKDIRDRKLYKALDNPQTSRKMSWEGFLERLGLSRTTIEERLNILDRLGQEFLELQSAMGLKRDQVRHLLSAPGELQAEATNLARAASQGGLPEQELQSRLVEIFDRIDHLEKTSAGRARLVEERDKAVETADLATGEAERAKKEFKVLMGNLRAHQDDNARLRRELDTPPRLRDQRLARQYLHDVELRAESVACRIEEAGEVVEHLFEEEQGALAEDLADAVLHATEQIFDRYVAAYGRFLRLPLWQPKHAPARAALAALLGDDLELSAVMQRVCDEMRAEEEAKQVVEAEGKG